MGNLQPVVFLIYYKFQLVVVQGFCSDIMHKVVHFSCGFLKYFPATPVNFRRHFFGMKGNNFL